MILGYSLLLDTHVLIWMATAPERIPPNLRKAIEEVPTRFVSHVSAWEVQIKHEKHGSKFGFFLQQFQQTMKAFSCSKLAIDYDDIRGLDQMRFHHKDAFDRMLMTQAARRSVYLATLDANIIRTFESKKRFYIYTDRAREE